MEIVFGDKFITIGLFIISISFGMKVCFSIINQNTSVLFRYTKIIE